VPPALLAAQLEAESGFDAAAQSPAGAQGMAQFMPSTWLGAWNPQREHSPFEPGAAIAAQARLMHDLLERSQGDIASALAAYNAGPAVDPDAWPRETRAYVARILRRFGGPATLGDATAVNLAEMGAASPSALLEVRLLP
jgi:soluble lytic murein transglycosylase-like protein